MVPNNIPSLKRMLTGGDSQFQSKLKELSEQEFIQVLEDLANEFNQLKESFAYIEHADLQATIDQIVQTFSLKIGKILGADRSTLFIVDHNARQLWSKVASGDGEEPIEIRLPIGNGLAGTVAKTGEMLNIKDAYNDDRFNSEVDKASGYKTQNILCIPLRNSDNEIVGVFQLLNKIGASHFFHKDEKLLQKYGDYISRVINSYLKVQEVIRQRKGMKAVMKATATLAESLDLEQTITTVMDEARKLMDADRSTLFLLDTKTNELWSKIKQDDGSTMDIRFPADKGIAGTVAQTGETLNIQNAYEDERFNQEVDQQTGYQTKTILCMPVYNDDQKLIGVTQLINKNEGVFTESDEHYMRIFNDQAGIALNNARLFEEVQNLQEYQRNILQSLSEAVVATDIEGKVNTINHAAENMLKLSQEEVQGQLAWNVIHHEKLEGWIESVAEKGESNYYPDQTITATKKHKSSESGEKNNVNITINPLKNTEGNVFGTLLVLEDISQEKRMKSALYRYMTQEVAEQIMATKDDGLMEGNRHEVSILFSDIRGYTQLTESLGAVEVVNLLNEFFERMVDPIFNYKGTVDKFIGDAIMAVFGAPLYLEDHATLSVNAALGMRESLTEFNNERLNNGEEIIEIGIGISSGEVVSGNIGSSRRMDYTAIGDGVNVSARLESITKVYGSDLVISEFTYNLLNKDEYTVRDLDVIRVKGRNEPVHIYEVLGGNDYEMTKELRYFLDQFEVAQALYRQAKFKEAKQAFQEAAHFNETDKTCGVFIKRCDYILEKGPEGNWDEGVWTMQTK
jgi:adenylate cyclase